MYTMWKTIFIIMIIMLALDAVFLTAMRNVFGSMVAKIQRVAMQTRLSGAVIVYALMVAGLYKFIISERRPIKDAAIFGMVLYGVFDFTNYTMFKNYDLSVAVIDTTWGALLMALTTFLTYKFM